MFLVNRTLKTLILASIIMFCFMTKLTAQSLEIKLKDKKEKKKEKEVTSSDQSKANSITSKSAKTKSKNGDKGTVTDVDGNTYGTINIDGQVWMSENLRVAHYQNGDEIENIINPKKWNETKTGAWAVYDNDETNNPVYGKLYNGFAVLDPRGICPKGWRVPTKEDWETLTSLYGSYEAGNKLKSVSSLWKDPHEKTDNKSGFSILPSGRREAGNFEYVGQRSYLWYVDPQWKSVRYKEFQNTDAGLNDSGGGDQQGYSCRCIQE